MPLQGANGRVGRRRHQPVSPELSIAQLLEVGRPELWEAFIAELRSIHLGPPFAGRSVFAELQAAYERKVAQPIKDYRHAELAGTSKVA